jgi:hypothetical protein
MIRWENYSGSSMRQLGTNRIGLQNIKTFKPSGFPAFKPKMRKWRIGYESNIETLINNCAGIDDFGSIL